MEVSLAHFLKLLIFCHSQKNKNYLDLCF